MTVGVISGATQYSPVTGTVYIREKEDYFESVNEMLKAEHSNKS